MDKVCNIENGNNKNLKLETYIHGTATANFAYSQAWLVNKNVCIKSSKNCFEIASNHRIEEKELVAIKTPYLLFVVHCQVVSPTIMVASRNKLNCNILL